MRDRPSGRREWRIRRYGFHGTSHHFVSRQAAEFLGAPVESLNQIVLHLGNGASASAIAAGRPIDTSMGLTPMEGLVMGTRAGDIDPGIISYLWRTADMGIDEIEAMLNRRSGMLGLSGDGDMQAVRRGSRPATRWHGWPTRCTSTGCASMWAPTWRCWGVRRDHVHRRRRRERRQGAPRCADGFDTPRHRHRRASQRQPRPRGAAGSPADKSPTTVLVIPTDEELAIARAALGLFNR